MINFDAFFARADFAQYRNSFRESIQRRLNPQRHGDLPKWTALLNKLPDANPSVIELNQPTIKAGLRDDISASQAELLHQTLMALAPWRKGPYNLFGTSIDTEWRSDWKWDRLAPHINSLKQRRVLDVGCGTGYHCWRMLGEGADYVMGIDPSARFIVQHHAVQKYIQNKQFDFIPIGIEDMPHDMPYFDTVFSMGVLYHRRNPINHLYELKKLMTEGGELVLETLIVDSADNGILQPQERYAQMRNVWSIMTVEKILDLLDQAGFSDGHCVDQNVTSLQEQRRTQWMQFHSLKEFLDPQDISKTVEGYPAPKRGLFIAKL